MKINPISNPNILRSYQTAKVTAPQKKKAEGKLDEVSFSEEALSFSKVMAEAKEKVKAEFNSREEMSRIEEIRSAVRQGSYRIDSERVAEKIISSIVGS